jgi:DNA modification methylase
MATDPPYLVDYDGGNHPQTWDKIGRRISSEEKTRHWDDYHDQASSVAFYEAYLRAALDNALSERPFVYQWLAVMRLPIVVAAWERVGLLPHQLLIWAKSRSVLTRCDYQWNYEGCMYGWRHGKRPPSSRRPPAGSAALWTIDSKIEDGAAGLHPTMKPVEVIRRPIEYHTKPAELIYEPFCGSGTALIAAEMSGRTCYAIEQSAQFVDVAVARWERFTGKTAVRDGALD